MLKELRYFIYIFTIFFFIFFTVRFYFSDTNKKIYYRSIDKIYKKLDNFSTNLKTLRNDTVNII